MEESYHCPVFRVDESTNADRGATAKQSDASPMDERLRKAIEARVGPPTPQMTNMKPRSNAS